jgi:hypothetical protein
MTGCFDSWRYDSALVGGTVAPAKEEVSLAVQYELELTFPPPTTNAPVDELWAVWFTPDNDGFSSTISTSDKVDGTVYGGSSVIPGSLADPSDTGITAVKLDALTAKELLTTSLSDIGGVTMNMSFSGSTTKMNSSPPSPSFIN